MRFIRGRTRDRQGLLAIVSSYRDLLQSFVNAAKVAENSSFVGTIFELANDRQRLYIEFLRPVVLS